MPGQILHYDGTAWRVQFNNPSGNLEGFSGIWGSSPTDVFAVSINTGTGHGLIYHYDGIAWSLQFETATGQGSFFEVWGSSATDVWAVGTKGLIVHYDGISWSPQASGVSIILKGSPWNIFS